MLTLALDTSTQNASLALCKDGEALYEINFDAPARVGEQLFSHLDELSTYSGGKRFDLITVGIGPGSFTGTRVGLATAKGLALAQRTPLVGVCSMAAIAHGNQPRGPVGVAVRAFRGEVYAAGFDGGTEQVAPFSAQPSEARARVEAELGVIPWMGTGTLQYEEAFAAASHDPYPRATQIAQLGIALFEGRGPDNLATLDPAYVRGADVTKPKSQSA